MSLFSAVHLEEHHLPGLPLSMVGLHIFLIWDHFFYNEAMAVISAWSGTLWWWWGCSQSGGLMRSATSWRARRWSVFPSTQSGSGWTLRAPDKRFTSPFSSSSASSSSSPSPLSRSSKDCNGWMKRNLLGGYRVDMYREEMKIFQISKYLALRRQQTESTKHKQTKNNHSNKKRRPTQTWNIFKI